MAEAPKLQPFKSEQETIAARLVDLELAADFVGMKVYDQQQDIDELRAIVYAQRKLIYKLYGIVFNKDLSDLED